MVDKPQGITAPNIWFFSSCDQSENLLWATLKV